MPDDRISEINAAARRGKLPAWMDDDDRGFVDEPRRGRRIGRRARRGLRKHERILKRR